MPNHITVINNDDIPDVLVFKVPCIGDGRGFFQEKFQREKLISLGLPKNFRPIQQNISYNKKKGVLRGIHVEPWNKYVSVIGKGKVFAAFVDMRPGKNYGKSFTVEIDEETAVFVPKGVGNSYQTLVPNVYYSYLVDKHWSPKVKYLGVNVARAGIRWPIPLIKSNISEKDLKNRYLKEIA